MPTLNHFRSFYLFPDILSYLMGCGGAAHFNLSSKGAHAHAQCSTKINRKYDNLKHQGNTLEHNAHHRHQHHHKQQQQ